MNILFVVSKFKMKLEKKIEIVLDITSLLLLFLDFEFTQNMLIFKK